MVEGAPSVENSAVIDDTEKDGLLATREAAWCSVV